MNQQEVNVLSIETFGEKAFCHRVTVPSAFQPEQAISDFRRKLALGAEMGSTIKFGPRINDELCFNHHNSLRADHVYWALFVPLTTDKCSQNIEYIKSAPDVVFPGAQGLIPFFESAIRSSLDGRLDLRGPSNGALSTNIVALDSKESVQTLSNSYAFSPVVYSHYHCGIYNFIEHTVNFGYTKTMSNEITPIFAMIYVLDENIQKFFSKEKACALA